MENFKSGQYTMSLNSLSVLCSVSIVAFFFLQADQQSAATGVGGALLPSVLHTGV